MVTQIEEKTGFLFFWHAGTEMGTRGRGGDRD